MRLSILAAALALVGVAASNASAELITREYPLFATGIALTYGAVIYDPQDGSEPLDLTGFPLVRTVVDIDYTPAPGEPIDALVIQMVIPVTGAQSEFLEILGSDMTQTTPGTWHYELDTDLFNGEIRPGRFSLTTYSADPTTGDPFGTNGVYGENSGISLIVQVPEPTTMAALGAGMLTFARRRRR